MKNSTKGTLIVVAIGLAIIAELCFKAWQCGEMFPNSSLLACIFWIK